MVEFRSILITGGTGSFGKMFVSTVLERFPHLERLIILSRDELKQFELQQIYPRDRYPQLRFFLGDVRDADRLRRAFDRVDVVVHAAALKQVPAAEYNPMEFIKTNVMGAQNVIEAAIDRGVKKVVALSTDKACAPVNLYGATKLCSDKLFIAANNYAGGHGMSFSVVRYGNVMGSRGSVIPFFLNERKKGVLPITHQEMTRFNITLRQGVELILDAIEGAKGGEIFVPRIPSYRILDLAQAIAPGCEHKVVGVRPGEKIHEEMISVSDAGDTLTVDDKFVILTSGQACHLADRYLAEGAKRVPEGFSYQSGENSEFLTVEELRAMIREHVDAEFVPS